MSTTTASAQPEPERSMGLLVAVVLGALIALSIGIYGREHDPSSERVFTLFFSTQISMKVYLASAAAVLATGQVIGALWIYGKLPFTAPDWVGPAHRISGRLAIIVSLPVAYHCVWSLGFQDNDTRALAHSLLGCSVYGAFAAKVTIVRDHRLPGWALPVAGGLLFSLLIGVWLTSGLWYLDEQGFPDP